MKLIRIHAPQLVLWSLIIIYCCVFVTYSFWKYAAFHYDNLDLAIFNQVFWNSLHGNLFVATIHPPSYLADHFAPLIILLLPLYYLWQDPRMLLLLQTVAIALTAWPVYLLARHFLKGHSVWYAVIVAGLWLANPLTHNMNAFEFELVPFMVLALLFALSAYLNDQKVLFVITSLLACSAREDAALIILTFTLISWIEKRSPFWKNAPLVIGIPWLLASFSIIKAFAPTGSYKFLIYYGWLGGTDSVGILVSFITHPIKLILHLCTYENIEFILGIGFPFLFLCYRKSWYWLLALVPAAQTFLSSGGGNYLIIGTYYWAPFAIALIPAFLQSMRRMLDGHFVTWLPKTLQKQELVITTIILASLYGALTYGSLVPAAQAFKEQRWKNAKQAVVDRIPRTASVASTFELLTPLSGRRTIASLHYGLIERNQFALSDYTLPPVDYIAIDWNEFQTVITHLYGNHRLKPYSNRVPETLVRLLDGYTIDYANGPLLLLKRGTDGIRAGTYLAGLVTSEVDTEYPSTEPKLIRAEPDGPISKVTIALPQTASTTERYLLNIITTNGSFMTPVGYGMFPTTEWKDASSLWMRLFVSPTSLRSIELQRWTKGQVELSPLKTLKLKTNATTTESITF